MQPIIFTGKRHTYIRLNSNKGVMLGNEHKTIIAATGNFTMSDMVLLNQKANIETEFIILPNLSAIEKSIKRKYKRKLKKLKRFLKKPLDYDCKLL